MVRDYRNGFEPFARLRNQVEGLMEGFPGAANRMLGARPFPALNVWDEGEAIVAEAELPGIKTESLDVAVVGSELTLRGERSYGPEEGAVYHRRERGTGSFTRVIRLPVEVDADRVNATLHDGVLRINLPKAEAAKPRKINVQPK